MKVRTTHASTAIELAAEDRERIFAMLRWELAPTYATGGRTAWLVLDRAASSPSWGPGGLRGAKLKGVGLGRPGEPPQLPRDEPHSATTEPIRLGIDDTGGFCHTRSAPAPLGGILHRRAAQEFERATALLAAGVAAVEPLVVVEYPDLGFAGEPLGAVVALVPDPTHDRLDAVLDGEPTPGARRLRARFGVADDAPPAVVAAVVARIAAAAGGALGGFAAAGLYRYSASWTNFGHALAADRTYLADLDSSRPLAELAPAVAAMHVLRDLASALHKVIDELYYPPLLRRLELGALLAADPFAAMIAAYLAVDPATARAAARPVWDYVAPHWLLMQRHLDRFAADWDWDRRQSYKVDRDVACVVAAAALAPVVPASRLAALGLPTFDAAAVIDRARRLLGDRIAYVERACADAGRDEG